MQTSWLKWILGDDDTTIMGDYGRLWHHHWILVEDVTISSSGFWKVMTPLVMAGSGR